MITVKFNRDDEKIAKDLGTSHRIYIHKVLVEEPAQGSMGNMVLLKNQLLNEELESIDARSNKAKDLRSSEEFKKLRFQLFDENKAQNNGFIICSYCKRVCNREHMHPNQATIDHVIPLSEGGDPMSRDNLVVACRKCNRGKRSHNAEDFKKKIKN